MKKFLTIILVAAVMMVSVLSIPGIASAENLKLVGVLSKVELAADGKSAVAPLKDNKTGEEKPELITDEQTIDKIKDKRIVEGDEIRCKYDKQNGKNTSKIFKKTAGC